MYTTVLCLLIAVSITVLAPVGTGARLSLPGLAHMALIPLLTWAYLRWRLRRYMVAALHSPIRAERLRPRFTAIVGWHQAALLAPFALFIYASDYTQLVVGPLAAYSEAFGNLAGLLPYLAFWFMLWWEAYPLKVVLLGRDGSRANFVLSHARMELPMAAPWFIIMLLGDMVRWLFPEADRLLSSNPVLDLLYTPVFLLTAGVFAPVLIKRLWGCKPIPAGELRDRLAAVVKKTGLPVREMLFWPLMEGRVLTAGIVGLVPRFRYLLITPALASVLSPAELDAVVGHEAGHVRHRHLWFYLLFFSAVLACGVGIFFQLAGAGLTWWDSAFPAAAKGETANATASLALTAGLIGLLYLGFRVFFGFMSRAFERQADLNALETMGDPAPITSALETISRYSGDIRDLPSWHHGSVAERVSFIEDAAADPSIGADHHKLVGRLKTASVVSVLLLAVAVGWLYSPATSRSLDLLAKRSGTERYLKANPEDAEGWVLLGSLRLEEGEEQKALTAFRRALGLEPGNAEALNGAAWLLATARTASIFSPREALLLAQRAAERKTAPHILDTLAEARFVNADTKGALTAIERAIELSMPDSRELEHYLKQEKRFKSALSQ